MNRQKRTHPQTSTNSNERFIDPINMKILGIDSKKSPILGRIQLPGNATICRIGAAQPIWDNMRHFLGY
jgi:hypothetical protein